MVVILLIHTQLLVLDPSTGVCSVLVGHPFDLVSRKSGNDDRLHGINPAQFIFVNLC